MNVFMLSIVPMLIGCFNNYRPVITIKCVALLFNIEH